MDIKIFQVFHKEYPRSRTSTWLKPFGVGAFGGEGVLSDGAGINIASLNAYYCELTAIYNVWKNLHFDYVGFCHYRRYLNFKHDSSMLDTTVPGEKSYAIESGLIEYLSDEQQLAQLRRLLSVGDVIIPRKSILLPTIKSQYLATTQNGPWFEFERCLREKYPQGVDPVSYFEVTPYSPICNMFVMKRDIFDLYCADLFGVIKSVFSVIGTPFNAADNRYPGYLAERFLGWWLQRHRIVHLEVPLIFLKDPVAN